MLELELCTAAPRAKAQRTKCDSSTLYPNGNLTGIEWAITLNYLTSDKESFSRNSHTEADLTWCVDSVWGKYQHHQHLTTALKDACFILMFTLKELQ